MISQRRSVPKRPPTPEASRATVEPVRPLRTARRPHWGEAAWAGVAALPVAASTLIYSGFFATDAFLPVLLGAALAAVPFALLAGRYRWRADSTLLLAVLAGFGYLCYALFWPDMDYGLPGPRTAVAVISAVAHGWGRMLSVALPADVSAKLLALPAAATWAASFAAVTIALRTRWGLGRLAPGIAAFTLAALCTASAPSAHLAPSAGFLAACAIVLAGASRTARTNAVVSQAGSPPPRRTPARGSAIRSIVVAICGTAVILAISAAGTEVLPVNTAHRFNPQELDPPVVPVDQAVTPLAAIRSQLAQHPAHLVATIALTGPGAAAVNRIRMAALEDYDGSAWTSSDRFLLASHILASDPGLRGALTVSARVTLAAGTGPYLPEAGRPTSITWQHPTAQQETGFDQRSGILVAQGLSGVGATYTLTAQIIPQRGVSQAVPATDPADTELAAPVPAILVRGARYLTANKPTPYGKLTALDTYLRSLPYSLKAPPGHSYGALIRMLTGTKPGDSFGYSEQHAAAFAVLARILGFPARVVTGYRLTGGTGVYRVTTADAYAWPEVRFNDFGWVAFDPTNTANTRALPQPPPTPPQASVGQNPAAQSAASSGPGPVPNKHGPHGNRLAVILNDGLYGLAALAALGVAGCAAIVAEKGRRHLRRRWASDPATRLLGAWQSTRDRLIEHGLDLSPSMTAEDVAAQAATRFDRAADPVGLLVPLVAEVVFTPDEPTTGDADQAWQLYRQFLRGLYPHWFTPRRITALASPRSLLASYHQARAARVVPRPPSRVLEGQR